MSDVQPLPSESPSRQQPWTTTLTFRRNPTSRAACPRSGSGARARAEIPRLARGDTKHLLIRQVVEAARFQRLFFHPEGAAQRLALDHNRQHLSALHPAPAPPPSYMMLTPKPLRDLVHDIEVLLAEDVEGDYITTTVAQVLRLCLYQPSRFPRAA